MFPGAGLKLRVSQRGQSGASSDLSHGCGRRGRYSLMSTTRNTGEDGLWAPLSSGARALCAARAWAWHGLGEHGAAVLTGLCGNLEKHTSLNLKLLAFNKHRGERKEKNADRAQSQINWDLTEENLRLYIDIYRFPQSIRNPVG